MSETAFLAAVEAFLDDAGLTPSAALIGPAEPVAAAELPALVLSLAEVRRLGAGLGERASLITGGALAAQSTIDLADPFLPGEPGFPLVSADRRTLILLHGGQVRADASTGLLGSADLQVSAAGAPQTVVAAPPGATEVSADPVEGILTFGTPLPPGGMVVANYFLGQWERRVTPLAGQLSIDVLATGATNLRGLSDGVVERLLEGATERRFRGLRALSLRALGPITAPDAERLNARTRTLIFDFDYEHEVDRAESSGGLIRRIPIITELDLARIDPLTGAVVFESEREESG